nr:PREDICTED: ubiquitin carboxyl-terminal hydrolase 6-like isoform X1 [Musa acuminata subsp. malaccensis]
MPTEKVQLTGIYDLVAVLTHEGRSADYVFWVKQENAPFDAGKWIQYDDHNPIPPRVERILQSYLAAVRLFKRNHTRSIYILFFFSLLNKLSQMNHITFFSGR